MRFKGNNHAAFRAFGTLSRDRRKASSLNSLRNEYRKPADCLSVNALAKRYVSLTLVNATEMCSASDPPSGRRLRAVRRNRSRFREPPPSFRSATAHRGGRVARWEES